MNTLVLTNALAEKIDFDKDNIWIALTDGRKLSVPLAYFPRLLNATKIQRESYIISGGGTGLHWDEIDEDISVENLILGIGDRTNTDTRKTQEYLTSQSGVK